MPAASCLVIRQPWPATQNGWLGVVVNDSAPRPIFIPAGLAGW